MFHNTPTKESGLRTVNGNAPLSLFQSQMNRLFSDFFDDDAFFKAGDSEAAFLAPAIDVTEDDTAYSISAELPGLSRDDIDVDISNNQLTIKGEKQTSTEDKQENFIRRERRSGSFLRTMALPDTVDVAAIKATFSDGVLQVSLPKKEEAVSPSLKVDIEEAEAQIRA